MSRPTSRLLSTLNSPIQPSLHKLNRSQLTRLALLTGCPVSGTKLEISNELNHAITTARRDFNQDGRTQPQELRVLSIDMGIRNLAYALLKASIEPNAAKPGATIITKPVIERWQRIAVGHDTLTLSPDGLPTESIEDTNPDADAISPPRESFEPRTMARHALHTANFFANLAPTHILIERQRFRSLGGAAVQEWSLRVGMFEAMLYALFAGMKPAALDGVDVQPVLPNRVNKFWLDAETNANADKKLEESKGSAQRTKQLKIDLVRQLMSRAETEWGLFTVGPLAWTAGEGFLMREDGKGKERSGSRGKEGVPLKGAGKLDDLADSLLQGLAWLKWCENRLWLAREGPDQLLS